MHRRLVFAEKLRRTTFNYSNVVNRAAETRRHLTMYPRNALAMKPLSLVVSKPCKPRNHVAMSPRGIATNQPRRVVLYACDHYLRLHFSLLLRRSILPRHEKRLRRVLLGAREMRTSSIVSYRNADSRWMSPKGIYIGS